MHLASLHFLGLVAICLALFHLAPFLTWRRAVLLIVNIVFVSSFARTPSELIPLGCFLLFGYICMRLIAWRRSRPLLILCVVSVLALFIYLKKYSFLHPNLLIERPYVVVGFSYILFRFLQVFVDIYQGAITSRISPIRFFNFTCSFLSFVSGPIQRFQDYHDQEKSLAAVEISHDVAYRAFSRIANGYLKIVFFAAVFQKLHEHLWGMLRSTGYDYPLWLIYGIACMAYLLYMYINFSGYMDVVIGIGWLFGFQMPENFEYPLGSENFLEFWNRWHITLSNWFKLYVFNPLVKSLIRRWPNPARISDYGIIAYFVTFFLMGLWHGTTYAFVIYGLFLGFGMSVNKLFEIEMRRYLGKKNYTRLSGNLGYRSLTQGLTIAYFAIALTCLWMNISEMRHFANLPGLRACIFGFGACAIAVMVVRIVYEGLKRIPSGPIDAIRFAWDNSFFRQAGLAVRVFALIFIIFSSHTAMPEIVYMGF